MATTARTVAWSSSQADSGKGDRGTQVAAILYSLIDSAKLVGLDPKAYLRTAALAGLRGEVVPLPHELLATTPSQ